MSEILLPTGTTAVDTIAADRLFFTNGSTRMLHTANASAFNASDVFSIMATTVRLPGGDFVDTDGVTLDALTVPGAMTLVDVEATTVSVSDTVSSNVIQSIAPGADTFVAVAKTIRLEADVIVSGRLDVVNTTSMSINDKVIQMGAIDANGDDIVDTNDLSRDGAGIVVPGPPTDLPVGKDAEDYAHTVKWRVHGGDFNPDGSRVVPQLKPMWEFSGGALSIAAPDTASRIARFVFAPHFTSTAASLGLYYAVGSDAYLVQSFSTTPLAVI